MISSSVLKGVTTYLCSLSARSAIYDENLKQVWTNCGEIFDTLDTVVIRDAFPIKEEKPIPVVIEDVKYVMNVVPLYRSKRLVCGYVCVLRDSFEIYRMVNSSAIVDFNRLSAKVNQEKLNRIISINKVIENTVTEGRSTGQLPDLLREQYKNALRLYTEASGSLALSQTNGSSGVNCNVSVLIKGLCTEANQCLVKTKRKLIKQLDNKNYYARIDYKTFSVAFIGIFRFHLQISPLKSSVEINSRFEDGNYIITVTTEQLPKGELSSDEKLKAQQDFELARKIVAGDCGGELSFTQNEKTAVTVIRVPAIKKNRGAMLNGTNSEYLTGSYRPLRPFVDEITEKEELAISASRVRYKPAAKETKTADSVQKKPAEKADGAAGGAAKSVAASEQTPKKKRGRPPGSKNKK